MVLFCHLEDIVVRVHQNVHVWEDKLLIDQRSHFFPRLLRHLAAVDFMQILWLRVLTVRVRSDIRLK
jgi:hypothetical protein